MLTARAARWATRQVGREGRTVEEVAEELGCGGHTVNNEVGRWGRALLEADRNRVGEVEALGLDETLFLRSGWQTRRLWCTSVVDVGRSRLIDVIPGRDAKSAISWLRAQPVEWLNGIEWAVMDLSGPYRTAYDRVIPHARQIADPFHVVRLANARLDQVRRRVQNETLGHRAAQATPVRDPQALTAAHERLGHRGVYRIADPALADRYTRRLAADLQHESCPPEINQLGRTIRRWHTPIVNRRSRPAHQRPHRSRQQPHQTNQTRRLRIPQLRQLPDPSPPLRRTTRLGPAPSPHSPLKSDEPVFGLSA